MKLKLGDKAPDFSLPDQSDEWSFLIDPRGRIKKIYEDVKPEVHAEEVLGDL